VDKLTEEYRECIGELNIEMHDHGSTDPICCHKLSDRLRKLIIREQAREGQIRPYLLHLLICQPTQGETSDNY